MTSKCPHGTPLGEDCGKCREIVDRQKRHVESYGHTSVFPLAERKSDYGDVLDYAQPGLDKREWLAGLALQGLLADDSNETAAITAKRAVSFADALLKELAK
jgi:hypothetical protein